MAKRDFHFYTSMVKSGIRILAGAALVYGFWVETGVLIIIAEILGIAEEM